jgi:phospholipase C
VGNLEHIKTIVIVTMENRSFDHVLGHLRMPEYGNRQDLAGLVDPTRNPNYANFLDQLAYLPSAQGDIEPPHDLPHGRSYVATQLAEADATFTMSGFVAAYQQFTHSTVNPPPPMAFMTPADVPVSHFLAQQYLVCDHWFSSLPTDTQPNRSVACSGYALIDDTKSQLIAVPEGSFILDWLSAHGVRWRVYHSGLSFFLLFGRFDDVLGPHFHSLRELPAHIDAEPLDETPQVIFIEPEYTDSPVHYGPANDNHPPTPMGPGEHFLRDIYLTLSKNPDKWRQTLMIVTSDEHGGFFDHVPPPRIATPAPPGAEYAHPFASLGPRVPALLISPWLKPGGSFNGVLDHTSVLQLLAEKFAPGHDYNEEVGRRRHAGIESVGAAFKTALHHPRADIPLPPAERVAAARLAAPAATAPAIGTPAAFVLAARRLLARDRARALRRFPELLHLPPP